MTPELQGIALPTRVWAISGIPLHRGGIDIWSKLVFIHHWVLLKKLSILSINTSGTHFLTLYWFKQICLRAPLALMVWHFGANFQLGEGGRVGVKDPGPATPPCLAQTIHQNPLVQYWVLFVTYSSTLRLQVRSCLLFAFTCNVGCMVTGWCAAYALQGSPESTLSSSGLGVCVWRGVLPQGLSQGVWGMKPVFVSWGGGGIKAE